jgi:serine/threonine protein kinase
MEYEPAKKIGEWIGNSRYQLVRLLGVGTYAAVYLALSPRTKQQYAIKCLYKEGLSSYKLALQKEEAELHLKVKNHKNIVDLIDILETSECFYLVLEFCNHKDLFDYIIESNGFDDAMTKHLFIQMIEAVEYCHNQGVYHRDIKPENILLTDDKTIKLADFGLATTNETSTEFGVGSYPYMSPEVYNATEKHYYSAAADVWSLGVILFSVRFARTLWNSPSLDDQSFAIFMNDPSSLKRTFNLTDKAYHLALRVFDTDPESRCNIKELKQLVKEIDYFQVDDEHYQYPMKHDFVPVLSGSDHSFDDELQFDFL